MKAHLRSHFRKKRSAVDNHKEQSQLASERLIQLPIWKNAKTVLLYIAVGSEINTEVLISEALRDEKNVLLPVTLDLKGNMTVGSYSESDLSAGNFTIPEPKPLLNYDFSVIDLVIVPGVAFDKHGGRLGQGKGYYDRFLSQTEAVRVGFCFQEQISRSPLPVEEHDARMSIIVTNEEVIECQ